MATRGKAAASTPDAPRNTILEGDALSVLRGLPSRSVQCVISSPPYYGLRNYNVEGQYGLEPTLDSYLDRMVAVFDEVFRVLRPDGVCWLNIGDSYAAGKSGRTDADRDHADGHGRGAWSDKFKGAVIQRKPPVGLKPKDLILVPFRLALALQAAGWYVRQTIIWHKPAPMPESVTDRCTTAHEYIFLLTRSERYYYDAAAIAEPAVIGANGSMFTAGKTALDGRRANVGQGPRIDHATRNRRSVWTVNTEPFPDAHYAVFPTALIEPMVLAGSRPGDLVLDPFMGSGTVGVVASQHGRDYLGIELSPTYAEMARQRIAEEGRPVVLPRKQRRQMRAKGVTQASLLESGVSA